MDINQTQPINNQNAEKVFSSRKANILPTLVILVLFFSIPALLLLIATHFSNPIVIIFALPSVWFFAIFFDWLTKTVPKQIIRLDDNGLEIECDEAVERIPWSGIKGIKFYSFGGGLTILMWKFAKYLGFFRLETSQKEIDLPPSIGNLDELLIGIVKNAHLKKKFPTFERSVIGGSLAIQRGWGNYPYWVREEGSVQNNVDFNTTVGGLSKSGIQLFFVLLLGGIFIFFLTGLLLNNKTFWGIIWGIK